MELRYHERDRQHHLLAHGDSILHGRGEYPLPHRGQRGVLQGPVGGTDHYGIDDIACGRNREADDHVSLDAAGAQLVRVDWGYLEDRLHILNRAGQRAEDGQAERRG